MATISISRNHTKTVEDLRKKIDEMSGSLEAKYGVKGRWQGNTMLLEGSGMARGVSGRIDVMPSQVRIELDLPLLLRAMKGQIEESLNRKIDRALAS
jgi:putative polyhydroxyalkanoate system protein